MSKIDISSGPSSGGSVSVCLPTETLKRMMEATSLPTAPEAVSECARRGLWLFERLGNSLSSIAVEMTGAKRKPASSASGSGELTKEYLAWWVKNRAFISGHGTISDETLDAFMRFLEVSDYKNARGETITKANFQRTFGCWLEIRRESERREADRQAAAAAREERDAKDAFMMNERRLRDLPFD